MKFDEIYKINVNEYTERKGGLTYLSWANAWAEFKKIYPAATYKVDQFGGLFCTGNETMGYMCRTEVTADGLTYEMWLPVMDSRNKSILKPTSYEINKTIMRCLAKNLAMFGLGLYIYAGEELPESEDGENEPKKDEKQAGEESLGTQKKTSPSANKESWRLSKTELVTRYEVESAEKAILYYQKALGNKPFETWTREDTDAVREDLEKRLGKKQAQRRLAQIDGDLPFGDTTGAGVE